MALSKIDQYKYRLKKYLAMHFQEVEMNRGKNTTDYFLSKKGHAFDPNSKTTKIEIDNTEIESCQKTNTIPKEIKTICK